MGYSLGSHMSRKSGVFHFSHSPPFAKGSLVDISRAFLFNELKLFSQALTVPLPPPQSLPALSSYHQQPVQYGLLEKLLSEKSPALKLL